MKYIFLVFFSTLIFGETYLTFQRNSTALVQNGFETIEHEATATNQAAYYPLYGNALDYSKNNNDGTVYGAVSTGTNYYFDGVDDYIITPITHIYTNNFTISCWFNTTESGRDHRLISQRNNSNVSFDLYLRDNQVRLNISSGYKAATISANDGEWHFVAMSFFENVVTGYHNASYIFCQTLDSVGVVDNVYIGRLNISPYNWNYKGYIKDVRIYDRALSATEINKIYNATK